jgi:hypothetical protein
MTIRAHRDEVRTSILPQHDVDLDRVALICDAYRRGVAMPLPLVVEDLGGGALVLDGHHRFSALKDIGESQTEAWVVSSDDFDRLIEDEFYGEMPNDITSLDDHIIIDNETYNRDGLVER